MKIKEYDKWGYARSLPPSWLTASTKAAWISGVQTPKHSGPHRRCSSGHRISHTRKFFRWYRHAAYAIRGGGGIKYYKILFILRLRFYYSYLISLQGITLLDSYICIYNHEIEKTMNNRFLNTSWLLGWVRYENKYGT